MDYLMKYIDYSDLNTSRMVLGSICSMLRKHKDYMLKYKDKFEKLEQTSTVPQVKDTAHDIILVLEGKRYKYSKTWIKQPYSKRPKLVKTDYHLMQVKSIAECLSSLS